MASQHSFQNWYEVLELSPDASHFEIQKAYQRAKETYSPDSPALYTMFTEEEARHLLSLIEQAYSVLGNVSRREDYDRTLKGIPATAPKSAVSASGNSVNLPSGFARTRHGAYEVKAAMEEEIKAQTSFDGEFLKKVRQYKNLTLDNLSTETRISRTYLSAIEENNYTALPASVFVRGFIVQFARTLGLPEQKVANSYMDILKSRNGK